MPRPLFLDSTCHPGPVCFPLPLQLAEALGLGHFCCKSLPGAPCPADCHGRNGYCREATGLEKSRQCKGVFGITSFMDGTVTSAYWFWWVGSMWLQLADEAMALPPSPPHARKRLYDYIAPPIYSYRAPVARIRRGLGRRRHGDGVGPSRKDKSKWAEGCLSHETRRGLRSARSEGPQAVISGSALRPWRRRCSRSSRRLGAFSV